SNTMNSLRYLNRVLTVLAILLTVNIYVQLTGTAAGSAVSTANVAHARGDTPKGVGSTAAREQAQLEELRSLNRAVAQLNTTLTNGSVRVGVDNFPAQGD
ncbi:MAG: hypothetical protein AAFX76_10995, partial [Planctomycetota bacterium]